MLAQNREDFMRTFLTIAVLLACAPAHADEDCNKATNQNEINRCAQDNYNAADRALNDAWSRLPGDVKAKLRGEERDWIARRDAACKAEAAESEGGSIYPTLLFSCMAEKTKARTRDLHAYPLK
jgi:uncharacterized protein YecT (DUF1311 family)